MAAAAEGSSASTKRLREEAAGVGVAAYPGDVGSLAHIAAVRFFGDFPRIELKGARSFANVFDAVTGGEALYGVVPIENSASGTLHSTYDLLVKHDVVIGAEVGVREKYCLCARPNVALADIRRVLSHPNILEACSGFVESRLPMQASSDTVPTRSTTDAARRVAAGEADGTAAAAIATREAAMHHGLSLVAEDIGNDTMLETRYIVIYKQSGAAASQSCPFLRDVEEPVQKHSACFALNNEPGAAYKLLSCWALRGIDVFKMETRPLGGGTRVPQGLPAGLANLWEYIFYVDFAVPAGCTEEARKRLWESLKEFSVWQRDFGTYPSVLTRAAKKTRTWEDMVDLMAKS